MTGRVKPVRTTDKIGNRAGLSHFGFCRVIEQKADPEGLDTLPVSFHEPADIRTDSARAQKFLE